jgi:Na+/proline symporter
MVLSGLRNDRNSTFLGDFYFGSWRSGAASGEQFKYFQFVLGNAIGFIFIAKVLLPLYYRMNLTSIYGYIERRLGTYSYKTAATIFLISRTIGSAFRLYLVVIAAVLYLIFTESFCSYRIDFISFATPIAAA